jgi:hypothetical protein
MYVRGRRVMAENTLSPVEGFERSQVKVTLGSERRYVLAVLCAERQDEYDQDTVRHVLDAGLEALGWPLERRILAFAEYSATCAQSGETNKFKTGRL